MIVQVGNRLQHRTMSAAAAEHLRLRIISGEYPAGSALRQDALAEELGISRIPLREALMQLEAEGLVQIVPHKGAVVSILSEQQVEELFELRGLLEPTLLRHSAPKLTKEDFVALGKALAAFQSAREQEDLNRWGHLNTEFHLMLYRHAGRPRALSIVATLLRDTDRHTRLQLSFVGAMAKAEDEHARIVRLCSQGNVAEAEALLRQHILSGISD